MKNSTTLLTIVIFFISILSVHAQKSGTVENYGENLSFGIAVGGGGILGIPVRFRFGHEFFGDIGPYYRPIILLREEINESTISHGVSLTGGINLFLKNKLIEAKMKYRKHGIFIRAGYTFSSYPQSIFGAGWVSETFKSKNSKHSFIFELGPGFSINHWVDTSSNINYTNSKTSFLISLKLHWNWFKQKVERD